MSEQAPPQPEAEEAAAEAERLFRPGESGSAWFVFHARPRCEKKAAETCRDLSVHHYLPLHRRRSSKKARHPTEVPLFPGYLFGCCDRDERLSVLRSGYLVRTIDVVDQQRLLSELYNIHLASHGDVNLTLFTHR